jgi:hypothetical protein
MEKFALKTKNGEIFNIILSEDKTTAIEHFAEVKNLTSDTLLSIFEVDIYKPKIKNKNQNFSV